MMAILFSPTDIARSLRQVWDIVPNHCGNLLHSRSQAKWLTPIVIAAGFVTANPVHASQSCVAGLSTTVSAEVTVGGLNAGVGSAGDLRDRFARSLAHQGAVVVEGQSMMHASVRLDGRTRIVEIPFSNETMNEIDATLTLTLSDRQRNIVTGKGSERIHAPGLDASDALRDPLIPAVPRLVQSAVRASCTVFLERGRPDAPLAEAKRNDGLLFGKTSIRKLQWALKTAGYDPGVPDGIAGGRTTAAIEQAENDFGMPVTGRPTEQILARLQGKKPELAFDPAVVDRTLEDLAKELYDAMPQTNGSKPRRIAIIPRGQRDQGIDASAIEQLNTSLERALTRQAPASVQVVARQRLRAIVDDLELSGAGGVVDLERTKDQLLDNAAADVMAVAEYRLNFGKLYLSLVATELATTTLLSSTRQTAIPVPQAFVTGQRQAPPD